MDKFENNTAIWHEHLKFRKTPYFEPIIPFINRFLKENECSGKLLDIGCGLGQKTYVFHKLGFEVTGIDGDSNRISKAQASFPDIDFRHFTFKSKLPFDDNSFDVVFASSVFQYLDHNAIISECKRILKTGGSIILIENLKNNPITRLGRAFLKLRKFQYQSYPWNHFTLKELEHLADEFDSTSTEVFHFSSPLALPFRSKLLYKMLSSLDRGILRISAFRRHAWLALFTATGPIN